MTQTNDMRTDALMLRSMANKLLRVAKKSEAGEEKKIPKRTLQEIAKFAAERSRIPYEVLLGRSRRQWVFINRATAMREMHDDEGYSLSKIGRFFGRDHSTVLHAVRRARVWHRSPQNPQAFPHCGQ